MGRGKPGGKPPGTLKGLGVGGFGVAFDEVVGLIEAVFAGLGEVGEAELDLAVEDAGDAAVVVGGGEAGIDVEGPGEGVARLGIVVEEAADDTYIIPRVGEVGLEADGEVEFVEGSLVGETCAHAEDVLACGLGLGLATAHLGCHEGYEGVVGVEYCRTFEVGECALEVTHMVCCQGALDVEGGDRRVGLVDACRQFPDICEVLLELALLELWLEVGEDDLGPCSGGAVELFDDAMEGYEAAGGAVEGVECHDVDGLRGEFDATVLHASAVGTLVLAFGFISVRFYDAGVVLDVAVAALSCLMRGGFSLTGAGVDARFHDLELIALGSVGVAQLAFDGSPLEVTIPELRVFLYDGRDVAQCSVEVAGLVEEECAVVEGYHVVGFLGEDEVEVLDGPVVIAHLCAEQSPVEVSEVVVGLQFQCLVIVLHGSSEVVLVEACEGAVDEVACHARPLYDGGVDFRLCLGVESPLEANHGTHGPRLCVEVIHHEC